MARITRKQLANAILADAKAKGRSPWDMTLADVCSIDIDLREQTGAPQPAGKSWIKPRGLRTGLKRDDDRIEAAHDLALEMWDASQETK